jgi:acyl-coenzyme A synthetase/AMP-(fatty) acid ligase
VWLRDIDERGVGTLAAAGPDCARYLWRPGTEPVPNAGYVTGTDYARFDAEGRLCLEGRVDGGEKLKGVLDYPRSVERHLLALDGVSDARVLVRRGPSGLEHLVAKVIGRVDEASVRRHCEALAEIERPSRVECVPEHDAATAYSPNGKL